MPFTIRRFATLAVQLGDKSFVTGAEIGIADPYLFVMLRWAGTHGIDVPERLDAYATRMQTRPSVKQALFEEGLG